MVVVVVVVVIGGVGVWCESCWLVVEGKCGIRGGERGKGGGRGRGKEGEMERREERKRVGMSGVKEGRWGRDLILVEVNMRVVEVRGSLVGSGESGGLR